MASRVNLNTANAEALAALPGIGARIAERIVAYRTRVGNFRTVEELAAVSGVTGRTIESLRGRVTVAEASEPAEAEELPMQPVRVRLKNAAGAPYTGHRVAADFTRREWIRDDAEPVTLWVPASLGAALPASGEVMLDFPNRDDMQGEVLFRVHAPDGELLHEARFDAEKLGDEVAFTVAPKQYAITEPNKDPAFGRPTRLRGRVIDKAGSKQVAQRQVVVWGAQKNDPQAEDFRALIVADTDASGYFSGPYPVGEFTRAHGTVALGKGEPVSVPIPLAEDRTFPETVILVVDMPAAQPGEDEECDCPKPSDIPRDPDAADLTRADGTYSSDPGAGRCVDFTKPDRTLEEYTYTYVVRTTEPTIKGLTLHEPSKIDISKFIHLFPVMAAAGAVAKAVEGFPGRSGPAEAATAPQLATTHINAEILQTLARDPDGFSLTKVAAAADLTVHADLIRVIGQHLRRKPGRGRLSCDNPVDWDHEPTIYQACTIAHGHVLRFKQEWVADGYSMGSLLYSLPLAPGQKKQIAVLDWERRETAARTEALEEREQLEAEISRDRDINEIVNATLSESSRGGSKAKSGSIAGGIGVGAIIGPVGGLLGIGGGSSSASGSAWQESSRSTAANALNQLRDRTTQSASALRSQRSTVVQTVTQGERVIATTETVANYNHCHAITIQYFEVLRHLLVRQRLVDVQECLFVPLLMSRFNSDKALRWRNTLRGGVRGRLRSGFDAMERIKNAYAGSDFPVGTYADQALEHMDGHLYLRFELARPHDTNDDFDANAWSFLGSLFPAISALDFYQQHLKGQSLKDKIFQEQMAPKIAERFVRHLKFYAVDQADNRVALPIDTTLVSDYVPERPLYVTLRLSKALPALVRKNIKAVEISDTSSILSLPLFQLLPKNSKVIVTSGTLNYRTKYSSGALFRDPHVMNDLMGGDAARIDCPLSRDELRNPREEDKELARQLLDHLNEHIEDFHHWLWRFTSDDRRYMLLDGFEAPNAGGRSVASVVENELIGIVGNCLILPVSRGFHLDPTFRQDVENPIDLLEHYQPNTPIEPSRVAVPTRGVYAEAVMGACNSCERKEEERFWRWEESPIPDSPPAILPVSTESRRAEPPSLAAKDFPPPMINLQNAPAAPDPTGLAAALQLLGTPNLFRDMAGLEGTQKNAAAALQAAFDTAQFFGGKAADLALQGKMARDIDKAMKTIQSAKQGGLITDAQAQELTKSAISGMIGGGTDDKPKAMSTDDVKDVADSAGKNNASIKVSRPTGEKVEVDAKEEEGKEDTKRSWIILSSAGEAAETRAFRPAAGDKSGAIDLEVTIRNMPAGGSVRWSRPDPEAITVDAPSNTKTRVRARRPGRSAIDVQVNDSGGNKIESMKIQLSVPQFVTVGEDAAAFDAALTAYGVQHLKGEIVKEAKTTVDHLLRHANARVLWRIAPLAENLAAGLPANLVMPVTIRGDAPAGDEGLVGQTNPPGGLAVFNESIDIFPGALDDAVPGGDPTWVDAETAALVIQIQSQGISDPAMEAFAVKVFGRLIGESMAHEIVHGMLWDQINPPNDHNSPPIANDLMNAGADRHFRQRTGLEDTALTSPIDPANFVDHGLAGIGGLQAVNQALMDTHFPVPPAFG